MYSDFKIPIYRSLVDFLIHAPKGFVPESDRLDNAALKLHLERLENGFVVRLGYNFAIYDRHKHPLDPADISACAKREGENILLPAPFARDYFGKDLPADADGYVNLTAVCAEDQFAVYVDEATGLVCVTPPKTMLPVNYTKDDAAFIARMAFVYEDPRLPMPRYNNTQSTRTMVSFEGGFPEDDRDFKEKTYTNLYSPSILLREENGKTVYYVSHEKAYGACWEEISTETVLLRSEDSGKTWDQVLSFPSARWTFLFEVNGDMYLCGSRLESHALILARVEGDKLSKTCVIETSDWTNPNACMVANGRIYLPTFPRLMSASVESDLLDPASWSFSNSLKDIIPKEWFLEKTGIPNVPDYWPLECNVVKSPDGSLHNIMRLECYPYNGYVALTDISPDGLTQVRNPECDGLVEMPASVSKFCVRYDETTKLYLALTPYPSLPSPVPCGGPPMAGQRNILAFAVSPDLIHWKTLDILLCDTEVMNAFCSARAHAFQYVMWEIDGDDIVFVVREACGFTKHYHDGKYATFYRFANYRKLIADHYEQTEFFKK